MARVRRLSSEIGINSARKKTGIIAIILFSRNKRTRTNPFRASIFGKKKKRSKIWTDLTRKSIVHPRTESLAKSWLRVDSKASSDTRIYPRRDGRADGFRKITFWFCSICRREIIRSRPPSLLPNTFFQIVPTSTLRYLEHSIRAYGIVAVFFVAKFDGKGRRGGVSPLHDCSIKRFTGERPRNRLPALSLSLPSFLLFVPMWLANIQ